MILFTLDINYHNYTFNFIQNTAYIPINMIVLTYILGIYELIYIFNRDGKSLL